LRNNYAYAKAGLGRLAKAKGDYKTAIDYTEQAIAIMSDVAFVNQLGDLYALKGDKQKAGEIRADVMDLLKDAEKEQNKNDASIKHNGARELAMAYMQNGKLADAYTFAKKDLVTRQSNIDANELAAWTAYLNKDYKQAKMYAEKMMATNSKNPVTMYKAGIILKKNGDNEKGTTLINEATAMQANIASQVNTAITY